MSYPHTNENGYRYRIIYVTKPEHKGRRKFRLYDGGAVELEYRLKGKEAIRSATRPDAKMVRAIGGDHANNSSAGSTGRRSVFYA